MFISEWETLDPQHNSSNHLINIERTIGVWLIVFSWAPLHPRFSRSERQFNEHTVIMGFSRYILFSHFHHTNFYSFNLHWCSWAMHCAMKHMKSLLELGAFEYYMLVLSNHSLPCTIPMDSLIIMVQHDNRNCDDFLYQHVFMIPLPEYMHLVIISVFVYV